jgi:hypothetical protein
MAVGGCNGSVDHDFPAPSGARVQATPMAKPRGEVDGVNFVLIRKVGAVDHDFLARTGALVFLSRSHSLTLICWCKHCACPDPEFTAFPPYLDPDPAAELPFG